ncbi:MAG: hypothetical protein ACXWLZ_03605 [Rhizomicrobium sp.]
MLAIATTIAGALGINVPRLIGYALVVVLVIGGAVAIKYHYINVGRQQTRDEIAAGNKETLADVNAATAKVDACRALGRQWDTVDGVCN